MKRTLLLEIGTEEIPAAFFPGCLEDLQRLVVEGLAQARLECGPARVLGTPRRLAVLVSEVAERQPDRVREEWGPPTRVAYDAEGQPTKAALHFAQKVGVPVEALERRQNPKGEYVAVSIEEAGRPAMEVLPEILEAAIRKIPWKKSMRWGAVADPFARPIHWILALFGDELVPLRYADVESGKQSMGHRFLANRAIEVHRADAYVEALREAHVLVDPSERRAAVLEAAERGAKEAGGTLRDDPDLVDQVTWLVELPSPIVGSFDPSYLDLPQEVLVSEMREHQKYFSVDGEGGKLLPAFVAIANTPVRDPVLARKGFERVLGARLADGRFFFDEDRKVPLIERVAELERVTFQRQLGSVHDKVERIRALAAWLAQELELSVPDREHVERAATLAKADLTTGMVGEFPELQGVMGREYALASGEPREVAVAIHEHYLPRHAGDVTPRSDVGAVVGLADRLDTICALFGIGKPPTGTADPFGLRRACLAFIHLVLERGYRLSLAAAVREALGLLGDKLRSPAAEVEAQVLDFFRGRLRGLWSEAHGAEVVEAVLAAGFDDLVATRARLEAVSSHLGDASFRALAEGFSRTNIVEKAGEIPEAAIDPALFERDEERELLAAFRSVREQVDARLASGDFDGALVCFTELREPLDRFFTEVMVMVDDEEVRNNRLRLLVGIRSLFGEFADFGRMDLRKGGGDVSAIDAQARQA